MITFDAENVINGAWLVFFVYWLAAARHLNRMMKREPVYELLFRLLLMAAAFILLYRSNPRLGVLNNRFVPDSPGIVNLGAAMTCGGVAFAIWARYHIGRFWSSTVSLRADHQLVRTGPYSRIRHPIYTGILLGIAGTALAIGRYRALVALLVLILGFAWKGRREEALLSIQFGPAFDEHKRLTGFFLPRFS